MNMRLKRSCGLDVDRDNRSGVVANYTCGGLVEFGRDFKL